MKQIKTTLYALNKDQTTHQEWKVFVSGNQIIVEFGRLGGKMQQKVTTAEPKNIGRANETTAEEQAELEAISKWEKQYRLNYREAVADLVPESQMSPMLAQDATKREGNILYPCYIGVKLDGLRALVTFDEDGKPVFNSRGNKEYDIRGDIPGQVRTVQEVAGFDYLDGEIYIHGLPLQKITALAKKWRDQKAIDIEIDKDHKADIKRRDKAIGSGETHYKDFNGKLWEVSREPVRDTNRYLGYTSYDLKFYVFDVPSDKPWFSENEDNRLTDLDNVATIISDKGLNRLSTVSWEIAGNRQEVFDSIGRFMQNGFEGTMIRNFKGAYEFGQRSGDLLKWKVFQDTEAKVIGVEKDNNGEGVLICEDKDGIIVRMKMKGSFEQREYSVMLLLVGQYVNFKYQARTMDNNYQFPVAQYVREMIGDTWKPAE